MLALFLKNQRRAADDERQRDRPRREDGGDVG
jgi:hypothetical protein